jgi:hypothetical protein
MSKPKIILSVQLKIDNKVVESKVNTYAELNEFNYDVWYILERELIHEEAPRRGKNEVIQRFTGLASITIGSLPKFDVTVKSSEDWKGVGSLIDENIHHTKADVRVNYVVDYIARRKMPASKGRRISSAVDLEDDDELSTDDDHMPPSQPAQKKKRDE